MPSVDGVEMTHMLMMELVLVILSSSSIRG